MEVVGTMFFREHKLLIDKPRKRNTYQMIGGKVEEGETPLEAAIRECHEELGNKAIIHFYVFTYNGDLQGELTTSEEIESFQWYNSKASSIVLSNTLKNEVIPYCLKNNLID